MRSQHEVFSEIQKRAQALREQTGYVLSTEQAIEQVLENEPALYREYAAAPSVPEVKKQAPAPVRTVKRAAEEGILSIAADIERQEGCDRIAAIEKAVATKEGRILYDVTRKPEYATMPVEKLTATVQKSTPAQSEASKIVPIHKRHPGRAFTYNQILALERGESPDAA